MTDSTNPRIIADNIKTLNARSLGTEAEIETISDAIEALGSYSTTEENTGKKWIDNSDIYRKVFYIESLPNATTVSLNHGITNLKDVFKLEAVAQATVGKSGLPFPYATTLLVRYTATEIAITASGDSSDQSAYITIEYTKTTPTP